MGGNTVASTGEERPRTPDFQHVAKFTEPQDEYCFYRHSTDENTGSETNVPVIPL